MSNGATIALITISTLSLLTSAATLTVVLVGGKKAVEEVTEVREKTNTALRKFKAALADLEI